MPEIQDWFNLDNIKTLAGATLAVRLWVELTKQWVDAGWQYATGHKPWTQLYAAIVSALVLFGIVGGDWRVNILNIAVLVAATKVMDLN